ncbi:DUF2934 domain-containing protein [Aquibium microcysteis]|uniref:DUF2934 domain-containing protein n=1 Tax=Aquibium microcysteis TaxID=675281 RepID=UPI00165D2C8B|nr:DUF2934 domain-containing protein [Aquibium microcysteis]
MNTHRDEQLRQRAYRIWEAEGRPEGREAEHWARAERELADEQPVTAPEDAAAPSRARRKAPAAEPAAGGGTDGTAKRAARSAGKSAAPRKKKV